MWSGLHLPNWAVYWAKDKTAPLAHLRQTAIKSAMAQCNFNSKHYAQVRGTKILSAKSWYMDHIIRETIQSKFRLTVNIEDGLTFCRSLKPRVHTSKQQRKPLCYYMQLNHDGHFKGQQIQTLLPPTASLSLHSSAIFYPWSCPLHKTTPPTDSLHQPLTCSFPTQHEHFFHAAYSWQPWRWRQ